MHIGRSVVQYDKANDEVVVSVAIRMSDVVQLKNKRPWRRHVERIVGKHVIDRCLAALAAQWEALGSKPCATSLPSALQPSSPLSSDSPPVPGQEPSKTSSSPEEPPPVL